MTALDQLPKNEWLPISRWGELRECGECAYELAPVIILIRDDYEDADIMVAGPFTQLDESPSDAHVAHFTAWNELQDWSNGLTGISAENRRTSKFESVVADCESVSLRFKHCAVLPPLFFMLLQINEPVRSA